MLYKYIAIVITLCTLIGCSRNAESHYIGQAVSDSAIADTLNTSASLFSQRNDIKNLRQAVEMLAKVRDPNKRNYEVEWKFAKYCYFLGKAEAAEKDSIAAYERGRDAGKIASRIDAYKPDGHFWYAANLGELGRISPVTVGIKAVDDIRDSMSAVIAIDPNYQNASAFDALGQLEMATRTLKGGIVKKAVEYYEKGLELSPDNANLRLHLAEAYLAMKKEADARKQLKALFALKPNPEYAVEHAVALEKGKEMLAKNF